MVGRGMIPAPAGRDNRGARLWTEEEVERLGKFPTERRGTAVCSGMIGAKETKEVSDRLYANVSALCPCTPLDKCCNLEVKGE